MDPVAEPGRDQQVECRLVQEQRLECRRGLIAGHSVLRGDRNGPWQS